MPGFDSVISGKTLDPVATAVVTLFSLRNSFLRHFTQSAGFSQILMFFPFFSVIITSLFKMFASRKRTKDERCIPPSAKKQRYGIIIENDEKKDEFICDEDSDEDIYDSDEDICDSDEDNYSDYRSNLYVLTVLVSTHPLI